MSFCWCGDSCLDCLHRCTRATPLLNHPEPSPLCKRATQCLELSGTPTEARTSQHVASCIPNRAPANSLYWFLTTLPDGDRMARVITFLAIRRPAGLSP